MNIGCMVWQIPGMELDFWQQLDWIKQNGFDEVSFYTVHMIHENGHGIDAMSITADEQQRLQQQLQNFKEADIHAPWNYCMSLKTIHKHIRQASLDCLKTTIILGGEIEVKTITVHLEDLFERDSYTERHQKMRQENLYESLHFLDEQAQENNVKIGLEVTADFDLPDQLGLKNTGITIDTGHVMLRDGQKKIIEVIEQFPERIVHLHIHDVIIEKRQDHNPLGRGSIDFSSIIRALKEIDYSGSLCLEINPGICLADELLQSRNVLDELLSGKK